MGLVSEFEEGGETGDVDGRIDSGEVQIELFDELEIGRAEDEDVDLNDRTGNNTIRLVK